MRLRSVLAQTQAKLLEDLRFESLVRTGERRGRGGERRMWLRSGGGEGGGLSEEEDSQGRGAEVVVKDDGECGSPAFVACAPLLGFPEARQHARTPSH